MCILKDIVMTKQGTPTKFKLSPGWKIRQNNNSLIVSGGADAIYEVGLSDSRESFLASLKSGKDFLRSNVPAQEQPVFEELVAAEVIVPVLHKEPKLLISVIGDPNKLNLGPISDSSKANLLVLIRTTSTLSDLLEKIDYIDIKVPHLFVDVAYRNTISVGPLVFPGETACIACLQGRITKRWGDEQPPTKPRATDELIEVASELVKIELRRIANNDTSLCNSTVSWNLEDRKIAKNQLLKVPLCPVCTVNEIDGTGVLALPWL